MAKQPSNSNKNINKIYISNNSPKTKSKKMPRPWHAVPLKGSFMLTAMLGFLISVYWVYPQSKSYGFTFLLVFGAMFIASLISMTKAPILKDANN